MAERSFSAADERSSSRPESVHPLRVVGTDQSPRRFLRGRERTLKGCRRRGPNRIKVLAYQSFDLLVEIREARFRQHSMSHAATATSTPGPERLRPR
jgi:hypothetical protein